MTVSMIHQQFKHVKHPPWRHQDTHHKDEGACSSAVESAKRLNSGPYPGMMMDRSSIAATTLATWCTAAQAMEFVVRGVCRPHVVDSLARIVTSFGPGRSARDTAKHKDAVIAERCFPTPHACPSADQHDNAPGGSGAVSVTHLGAQTGCHDQKSAQSERPSPMTLPGPIG
jgi:hypothetical protein